MPSHFPNLAFQNLGALDQWPIRIARLYGHGLALKSIYSNRKPLVHFQYIFAECERRFQWDTQNLRPVVGWGGQPNTAQYPDPQNRGGSRHSVQTVTLCAILQYDHALPLPYERTHAVKVLNEKKRLALLAYRRLYILCHDSKTIFGVVGGRVPLPWMCLCLQ